MLFQEGRREEWDILFSLAQWGHLYWNHIKTVVEVSSKCPLVDSMFQIAMRSRDESGVDWLGVRGTHGTDFMLLNYAKKFSLQLSRQFSNFVQEESSSICGLNQPFLVCIHSRECTAYMPEQFGFNQSGREG
jgi:hypothetical protein